MRRLFALLAALVLILGLPASGIAGRIIRTTDHVVGISCDGVLSTDGTAFAFFVANVSDMFGPDVFLDLWHASAPAGNPDVSRDYGQPATVTWAGPTLAGTFFLVNRDGTVAGNATFSAVLTPAGPVQSFSDSMKNGNQRSTISGTDQPFSTSGLLTIAGGASFDLAACVGDETTVTTTDTSPNSVIRHFTSRFVSCELSNTAGDTANLFIDLSDTGGGFIDSVLIDAGGNPTIGAQGSIVAVSGTLDGDLTLYDINTGGPVAGTGHISATIAATGLPFKELLRNATGRRVTTGQVYDIEGTLTIAGHAFDLGACVAVDSSTKVINTFPRGPKPGGKVPANDLPSGAKLIKPGSVTTMQTKGASPDAEAPYDCLTFTDPVSGEVFSVPVGNTVWYAFAGTGSPMTVDTAGSDFDTVAAVYTSSGTTLRPVPNGCVDDTPTLPVGRTLQAAVTIPTVTGTTYLVQIGGFPESFPYGNLRVSLR